MKFILVTIAVAIGAAGVAFLVTAPATPAASVGPASELAGDWRCNNTIDGVESVTLFSVADDGSTRGQVLLNSEFEGQWVTLHGDYTSHMHIEDGELVETVHNLKIKSGIVDGVSLPPGEINTLRDQMGAGSGTTRYGIENRSASSFTYTDDTERAVCERSPVPLNL